jgi:hypothetical protein
MGLAGHAAGADDPLSVELRNYRSTSVPPALLLLMDCAAAWRRGAARERVASRFDLKKGGSTRRERE